MDNDVQVTVGDTTYVLRPTLSAMRSINRAHGSLRGAAERVRSLDFEAVCQIIAAGADLKKKQSEALEEKVFQAGIANVVAPVAEFIAVLFDPAGKADEESDEGNAPSL